MVIGTRTSVPSRSAGTDRGRKRFCYVVKPPRGRQFREVHLAWIAIVRLRLATLCLHYSRQVGMAPSSQNCRFSSELPELLRLEPAPGVAYAAVSDLTTETRTR